MPDPPANPPLLFILHVETRGVEVELFLNGAPVFREAAGAQRVFETKVNMYVHTGENELRASIRPTRDPEGHLVRGERYFSVQMQRGHLGSEIPADGVLIRYPDGTTLEPLHGPLGLMRSWRGTFEVRDTVGPWGWEAARAAPIAPADRQRMTELLVRLHFALATRDMQTLALLLSIRRDELCRSLSIDRAKWEGWEREEWAEFFESEGWKMDPLRRRDLVFHPYADGRLVAVTDRKGRAPLRGRAGEQQFRMAPMFGRVEGYWEVVR